MEILPWNKAPRHQVLAALTAAFGTPRDSRWLAWKHEANPAGRSLGWVALDGNDVLGVRLFLRWRLVCGDQSVLALRPVDTATVPTAQRRGIFRTLTEHALGKISEDPDFALIFNTPNHRSRPGYVQMGWSPLEPVRHVVGWSRHAKAELLLGRAVLKAFEEWKPPLESWSTSRSPDFLRWRYDDASGAEYRMACLRHDDDPNGMIYRLLHRRGLRSLAIHELEGSAVQRRLLLRSVARRERARVWLAAAESMPVSGFPRVRFGRSWLVVRTLRPMSPDPTRLASWSLSLGDLEARV